MEGDAMFLDCKESVSPKLIYRFDVIPVKIPFFFFVELTR